MIIAQTSQLLPVFEADTWQALTTPGEPAYHPRWAPWIIAELTINPALLARSMVVAFPVLRETATLSAIHDARRL